MVKKLAIVALTLALLGPLLGLIGIAVVMNPAAAASCTTTGSGVTVGDVPDELAVTTANGETFTLNKQQLTHAATIIETGSGIDGITRDGLVIALMAALTESTLRQLANTSTYPDSANYPNDATAPTTTAWACSRCAPNRGGAPSPS